MFFFILLYEKRLLSWILFAVTFSLLIYGLFTPQVRSGLNVPNLDKFIHLSAFFVVFMLGRFATHTWIKWLYWLLPYTAAIFLEYLQGELVVSRQFSYADMAANVGGVTLAAGLWALLMRTGQFLSTPSININTDVDKDPKSRQKK